MVDELHQDWWSPSVRLKAHDSDCDAPMSLVNMTFDWMKKEWADEVDFVVWTGDNARSVGGFI